MRALLTTTSLIAAVFVSGCPAHHSVDGGGDAGAEPRVCTLDASSQPIVPIDVPCPAVRPDVLEVCIRAEVAVGERWPSLEVTDPAFPCDRHEAAVWGSGPPTPDRRPDAEAAEEAEWVVDVGYQTCSEYLSDWCACHPEPVRQTQTVHLSPHPSHGLDSVIRRVGTRTVGLVVGDDLGVTPRVPYVPVITFEAVREDASDAIRCFTLRPDP